jgi:Tol biopolymer transport system component/tRNA A-37 threonylcarbamoyl transferase component Bud32
MSLAPSTRLGPYEVLSPLGAGGMGEVYKARDTRLDRTVAIKILPEHLSSSPQIRERFEREAKAISSLSHPHICPLYDVGHQDGIDFLVMEYLEGETLAHRLKKGPLPADQVLRYAIEIADALDTAHRHGVIHRDLKPGNVMLTKSGTKLLDFGLAKVRAAEAVAGVTVLPTQTTPLTAEGTILGTLQYMAPEQLEGKEADARTDIFALGEVIYEMATGRKAFEGKSHAGLIAAILEREPPSISTSQPMAPPALDHVVRTSMAKDPDARWQTAHDVLLQLNWIAEAGSQAGAGKPAFTPRSRRQLLPWLLASVVSVALLALALVHFREKPAEVHTIRFTVPLPGIALQGVTTYAVISPDGRRMVIGGTTPEGKSLLWIHSLDSLTTEPLAGTDGAVLPFWSPDSRSVAFFSGSGAKDELKKIDMSGGPVQTICEVPNGALGGDWNQDGVIVLGNSAGPLLSISADGGSPQPVTELVKSRRETGHMWPHFLPDGRRFLYLSVSAGARESGIYAGSLDSRKTQLVIRSASNVSYVPPGYLVYSSQGTILAQKADADSLRVSGSPFPIAPQVSTFAFWPGTQFSTSRNGVLAYVAGSSGKVQLAWYDRDGKRLGSIGEPGFYPQISLSPDEKRLAVQRTESNVTNLWILELARGIFSRLTFNPDGDLNPQWSPDGRELLYTSTRNGHLDLYRKPLGGAEEQLVYHSEEAKGPFYWSKDGWILFVAGDPGSFYRIPLAGERKPLPALKSDFGLDMAAVSQDGRWVAWESGESGRSEVYAAAYPAFIEKRQVSIAGGCQPLWRRDSKELFYLTLDGKLEAVDVRAGATLDTGTPHMLFRASVVVIPSQGEYCVTGDGKRFIFREPVGETTAPVNVVVNWTAGLRR